MEKLICENCGREHDGSCGSGRFCSKKCSSQFNAKNRRKCEHKIQRLADRSPIGTWKCCYCDFIAETKAQLKLHKHEQHPNALHVGWNKGLTKETNASIAKGFQTFQKHLKEGMIVPHHHHWTDEERKRISERKKANLKAHPEKHTWKKIRAYESKPCEILKEFLKSENILFYPEYTDENWTHSYSIDIAFPNNKFGIEINGNQHYDRNGNLQEYFQKRHEYLSSQGWRIVEVPYKMAWNEQFKAKIVDDIKHNADFMFDYSGMMKEYLDKKNEKYKQEHTCPQCGGFKKSKKSRLCSSCSLHNLKVEMPTKEELERMIFEMPITKLSEKLGVSHVLIGKWCKKYNIVKPEKGYWTKKRYENHVRYTNAEHGTGARYAFGCRCEKCRSWNAQRTRIERANWSKEYRAEKNRLRREKRKKEKLKNIHEPLELF